MNRQDFYYDQLVKQMDLDLLQDNAERGIGAGLKDTWGTGLSSIAIIAHENGSPDMNVLVPAGSARVQETGTIETVGTLVNGSPIIIDIPNTARLSKGDDISGTGIPGSTKILTVDGVNQITIDKNSTADNTGVTLTITYIKYTRAVWIAEQTIDCSQDWETNSTIPAAGKECYIACYVKQSRDLFDQRQDGFDPPNTIDYRQLEGAEFRVYKGADANPANAVKVSSPGDEYELVFEVLFDENTTVINDAADKYNPEKDEIDYTDVVFLRSQELKDALGDALSLSDKFNRINVNIKTVTSADYIILDNDGFGLIRVSTGASDRTITYPTLADNLGRKIIVKKIDSGIGKVTVDGKGAEEIDGDLEKSFSGQNQEITVIGTSSGWAVIKGVAEFKSQIFLDDDTFIAKTDKVIVTLLGAGGGGGGGEVSGTGGGGGAGEYIHRKVVMLSIGDNVSITIAPASVGGDGVSGSDGGDSLFGGLLTARGGKAGITAASGNGGDGAGNDLFKGTGGTGGNPGGDGNSPTFIIDILGGAGGGGGSINGSANNGGKGGNSYLYSGGAIGNSVGGEAAGGGGGAGALGDGGNGGDSDTPGSDAVVNTGAGGGGAGEDPVAFSTKKGGDGGSGYCLVEWIE